MCLSWPGQGCNYVQGEYAVSNMVAITVRGERTPETCLLLIQGSGCTEHPANAEQSEWERKLQPHDKDTPGSLKCIMRFHSPSLF